MYVRFGNDFNAAAVAFDGFGIDMGYVNLRVSLASSVRLTITHSSELKRVPEDLRDILERCLADDASQENLALYLPNVRKTVTHLLEGLRKKQDEYRLQERSR